MFSSSTINLSSGDLPVNLPVLIEIAFVEVNIACFLLTEISDNCLDERLNLMFELRIPMLDSCLEYES